MNFPISLRPASAAVVFANGNHVQLPGDTAMAPWRLLRAYYRDRVAWVGLLVFAVLLAYGGGAVMFWFHAIYLGEGGPAISPWLHWLLDSTAGFVGLTPALVILMPLVASVTAAPIARPGRYALLIGTLFAFVTAPGPIVHNAFVGRGTWVANHVTALLGGGRAPSPVHHVPPIVDIAGQVAVGLPTYILLAGLALLIVRALSGRTARAVSGRTPAVQEAVR
jgi:hypothetical protein